MDILKKPVLIAVIIAFSVIFAGLSLWKFGFSLTAAVCFLIFVDLMLISFADITRQIIPNKLVIVLAALSIAWAALYRDAGILHRIIGFFILSVPMLTLTFFIKDAFGGGDIKLIAVCGFLLGFKLTLLTGFIAVILGGCCGFYLKYIRRKKDKHFPFGQYICFGAFVSMLCGNEIIRWYFNAI